MKHTILVLCLVLAGCGSDKAVQANASSKALHSVWTSTDPAMPLWTIDLSGGSPGLYSYEGLTPGSMCDCPFTIDETVTPATATGGACTFRAGTGSGSDCPMPTGGWTNPFEYNLSGATLTLTSQLNAGVYTFR